MIKSNLAVSYVFYEGHPKVSTKEELKELLEKYKLVINNYMIDYLKCLIDLEVPVTKEYITDIERNVLAELEIYRKASIYNICNFSKKVLKEYEDNYYVETIDEYGTLRFRLDGVNVLGFDYRNSNNKKDIGILSLYQNVQKDELTRHQLITAMQLKLDELYSQENPFPVGTDICEGPGDYWEKVHSIGIRNYEELLNELKSLNELTEQGKKSIKISKEFHDSFFAMFGLEKDSFSQEPEKPFELGISCLEKTLVKKMPLLRINDYIKYI